MWELATRSRPWSELDNSSVIAFKEALSEALLAGRRPALPDNIDAEHPIFVKVMRKAWATDPDERPSFSHIVFSLEMIESQSNPLRDQDTMAARAVVAPSNHSSHRNHNNNANMDSLTEPLLSHYE